MRRRGRGGKAQNAGCQEGGSERSEFSFHRVSVRVVEERGEKAGRKQKAQSPNGTAPRYLGYYGEMGFGPAVCKAAGKRRKCPVRRLADERQQRRCAEN